MWQHAVPASQELCHCHRMDTDTPLELEGKAANTSITCSPQSGTLSSFCALTLLVGNGKGICPVKNTSTSIPILLLLLLLMGFI